MKIRHFAYFFAIGKVLFFYTISSYAASPVWTLTPLTATTLDVPTNSSATVQYIVTNQARKTLTLAMKPIQGIMQNISGPGICPNPFSLAQNQSCTLSLSLDGSALPQSVKGGPVICQTNANGTPNPNSCYQPSSSNQLNITKVDMGSTATIAVSVSTIALSVNCPISSSSCIYNNAALTGTPRIIIITNNSTTETGLNVSPSAIPALPPGTTITPNSCTISPLASCAFTITPGEVSSAQPGDSNPASITLTIAGSNTNTLSVAVDILTYGSVYQSGYVFAVDDTTPNTGSATGKVAGLSDLAMSIAWQPNCIDISTCAATTANDFFNGADNTTSIVSALNAIPSSSYAAGICDSDTTGDYSDWYLPALCELGYGDGSNSCGIAANPAVQNMQSNLVDNGISDLMNSYWSSTQALSSQLTQANYTIFNIPGFQAGDFKDVTLYVRCIRSFL